MSRRIGLIFLWVLFALICPAQEKKRVAVLDFEYGTVSDSVSAVFGTNLDVGKGIADLVVEDLVKSLDKLKVPAQEKGELLTALGGMKGDIVNP